MTLRPRVRIEYILILLSALSFAVTALCTSRMNREYAALDGQFTLALEGMERGDRSGTRALREALEPYLFLDDSLAEEFTTLFEGATTGGRIPLQNFQNKVHARQRVISQGFSQLTFFSAVILSISVMLILIRQGREKAVLSRVLTAEREKKAFSRNLHDGVAQDLAAARLYIQQDDRRKSEFYLKRAFEEVRCMIDQSHMNLSEPLEVLVRDACRSFEANHGIRTQAQVASNIIALLDDARQMEILYILQEALSNIARHAQASEVSVKIIDVADALVIRIHDNGRGFCEEASGDGRRHWGLVSMRERVALLGGHLEILSEGGTTIAIRIENPLP